jgi:hypothetical protein
VKILVQLNIANKCFINCPAVVSATDLIIHIIV